MCSWLWGQPAMPVVVVHSPEGFAWNRQNAQIWPSVHPLVGCEVCLACIPSAFICCIFGVSRGKQFKCESIESETEVVYGLRQSVLLSNKSAIEMPFCVQHRLTNSVTRTMYETGGKRVLSITTCDAWRVGLCSHYAYSKNQTDFVSHFGTRIIYRECMSCRKTNTLSNETAN